MKIAIDIDGVLLDIVVNFCKIFNKKHGTSYNKKDITNWEFFNNWNITEEEAFKIFFQIYENTMSVPFIDKNAPKYMEELNHSHEVYILSARTSQYRSQIIEKLNFHGIKKGEQYIALILVEHKPYASKQDYEFDIYVDDNPHLANAIKMMKDRYMLLYDQPWNKDFLCTNNVIRVYNWNDVYEQINDINFKLFSL
ncbi:MAG: hypothetical protein ACFFHV_20245 [Promethearchaeota archaeon]